MDGVAQPRPERRLHRMGSELRWARSSSLNADRWLESRVDAHRIQIGRGWGRIEFGFPLDPGGTWIGSRLDPRGPDPGWTCIDRGSDPGEVETPRNRAFERGV